MHAERSQDLEIEVFTTHLPVLSQGLQHAGSPPAGAVAPSPEGPA
ncbi:hypothetical protein IC007_0936 [Sulfuracidifex tepidarius]|uniref:Uncharacterized protein n=1 Tax=Sulfuracidifex tepidarius TaxID=1294262 RepID=A0A510E2Z4_9CREN|nr:hypothetical protein IC007_0936 [Sulfuracidifex tepidarius]